MEQLIKYVWVSVHVYPLKETHLNYLFWKKTIQPLIAKFSEKFQSKQYFFIRYNDPEFHIRLRLKLDSSNIGNFQQFVNVYFGKKKLANKFRYSFVNYQPEINRYGGYHSIKHAEEFFYISSQKCLQFLIRKSNNSYNKVIGEAIKQHLELAIAFNLTTEEAIVFFYEFMLKWLPINFKNSEEINFTQNKLQKDEVISKFKLFFTSQKDYLSNFIRQYWYMLNSTDHKITKDIDQLIFNLKVMNRQNKINIDKSFYLGKPSGSLTQVFAFMGSIVHMTNNRLGIDNRDETYIAYVLYKSLQNDVN